MSRDLPAALTAAIDAPVVRPFLAFFIDLPDPVRVWTGRGTLRFADAGGVTRDWTGAGDIGAIDEIAEAGDGSATGVRLALLNAPAEFREDIAQQATRGAAAEGYAGALNETFQQVEAVVLLTRGRVDDYQITDAGSSIGVEVAIESRSIDQRRPAIKKFTDEYQQRKHPGDLFFQYVSQMAEVPILWAQAEQKGAAAVSGGGGGVGGGGFMRIAAS